jgi:hypothetical protein
MGVLTNSDLMDIHSPAYERVLTLPAAGADLVTDFAIGYFTVTREKLKTRGCVFVKKRAS